jgi:hypothetical protein
MASMPFRFAITPVCRVVAAPAPNFKDFVRKQIPAIKTPTAAKRQAREQRKVMNEEELNSDSMMIP